MKIHYFLITIGEQSMTVLGGDLLPSKRSSNHVWITSPSGDPLFEVHKSQVRRITKKKLAKLMMEDAKYRRLSRMAPNN